MRIYLIIVLVACLLTGCKKDCGSEAGQYYVPLNISISPVPKVKFDEDSLLVRIWIDFANADMRLPEYTINLKNRKPAPLYVALSAPPTRWSDNLNGKRIFPIEDGYLRIIPVKGIEVEKNGMYWNFVRGVDSWEISFYLVPIKRYDGVYYLRPSITQFKDRCTQVDPITTYINTTKNHHLVGERFDFDFSPNASDVLFYVE